jgi:hypothetical protein
MPRNSEVHRYAERPVQGQPTVRAADRLPVLDAVELEALRGHRIGRGIDEDQERHAGFLVELPLERTVISRVDGEWISTAISNSSPL